MLSRILLAICIIFVSTLSYAQPRTEAIIHDTIVKRDTYKTEDILLLFKSCYETIYFLGNTKYKRTKKTLKEEDVSRQCFCICDKIRAKYEPRIFLDRPPIEIHNIIKPLTSECIKERGQIWHDNKIIEEK